MQMFTYKWLYRPGKAIKKKGHTQSGNGNDNDKSDGGVKKPFRGEAERSYSMANNMCWHCATPGHRSSAC